MSEKDYKETDKGFVSTSNKYEDILKDPDFQDLRDLYKVPLGCPACNKLMYNWDTKFFYRHGVCADCTVDYIEDRDVPEAVKNHRKALLQFVKDGIEEKKNRKAP